MNWTRIPLPIESESDRRALVSILASTGIPAQEPPYRAVGLETGLRA